MLFNSIPFIFFFIVVVTLYFALPQKFRWMMLLAASYYFYMCWKVEYVLLIMFTTTVDYCVARQIARCRDLLHRRKYLAISLLCNLSILFGFKYFNFFSQSVTAVLSQWNIFIDAPVFHALLPVGISFYTFQSLSYVLDVYYGRVPPEKHLGYYALYVSFWPQLVAGPIERSQHLLPQLRAHQIFDVERATSGLRLILFGLFKKIVIADHLAVHVNRIYNHSTDYSGGAFIVATIFFAIQIYCDFSGYTDVARGSARVMGYDLMENFRAPYLATSIHDFWRRWHISLSTWFRDYVYIPLGGNRKGRLRWNLNLLITFFISGLWHGANWTFVIWGTLHGCFLVLENILDRLFRPQSSRKLTAVLQNIVGILKTIMTFLLVCFCWIFFRAENLGEAVSILVKIGSIRTQDLLQPVLHMDSLILPTGLAVLLFVIDFVSTRQPLEYRISGWPAAVRWPLYTCTVWSIGISAVYGVQQKFIYFQF